MRCFSHSQHQSKLGDTGADQDLAGGIINLIWPGNALGSRRRSWKTLLRRGISGIRCIDTRTQPPIKRKKMDRWISREQKREKTQENNREFLPHGAIDGTLKLL